MTTIRRAEVPPLSILLVLLTLACSDSLAPGDLGQEYLLVNVADDALPTVLVTTNYGNIRVISQSIRFGPKGSGSITEATELVPHAAGEPPVGPTQTTFGIQWVEADRTVQITFDCPPNALCVAGPHLVAQVGEHTLRATWGRHLTGRSPLLYEEVVASP